METCAATRKISNSAAHSVPSPALYRSLSPAIALPACSSSSVEQFDVILIDEQLDRWIEGLMDCRVVVALCSTLKPHIVA